MELDTVPFKQNSHFSVSLKEKRRFEVAIHHNRLWRRHYLIPLIVSTNIMTYRLVKKICFIIHKTFAYGRTNEKIENKLALPKCNING